MAAEKILIKKAKIIDPNSPFNGKKMDILIENDVVKAIEKDIPTNKGIIELSHKNLHISPGWFDLRANFCDPGHEEREDIESGIYAAIYGGFTGVGISPETNPVIDNKASIEYIYQRSADQPVSLYPYGSLTKGLESEELSEMYDMYEAGAVGFSNGKKSISNAALMNLALLYCKDFAPPIHSFSLDESLARKGQMHEGETSTYLGLKGIPALAEEVRLLRDLHLAEYAECGIHFMAISSASGVKLLRNAKRTNQNFTADVAVANLILEDIELEQYDTRYKVQPPLRGAADRKSLIKALKDNVIQVITSDHTPIDIENKKCEFDQAEFGMIGLESMFGCLGALVENGLSLEEIITKISINPRKVLHLETPSVAVNSWAEFTLFDPNEEWTFQKDNIQSKSANSPFIGKKMKGKALGIINNGIVVWMPEER